MRWKLVLLLFLYSIFTYAQMTTVTATVVDSDGTTWANGSWSLQFYPNPNYPNLNQYNYQGSPLSSSVTNQQGTIDNTGYFSLTVYTSSFILPLGSQWKLTVCPNASAKCGSIIFAAAGASEDISSTLTASLPPPRFQAVAGSYGYTDTEAQLQVRPGSTYWNVADSCQRYYNTSTWSCNTTGGPYLPLVGGILTGPLNGTSANFTEPSTLPVQDKGGQVFNVKSYGAKGDGTTDDTTAIAAAYTAAGSSGTVFFPPAVYITTGTTITANTDGVGATLKASSTMTGSVATISGSNITVDGLTIDGNRAANTNSVDCLHTGSGNHITITNGAVQNCQNQGIYGDGGSSFVTISNMDFSEDGNSNPASPGTGAITLAPGTGSISHYTISGNRIHDSNGGIEVTNSTSTGLVTDTTISGNRIYANTSDGISITANTYNGGSILRTIITGNEIYCNGWPSAGLPSACTPGAFQTGTNYSPNGVGIDLISNGLNLNQYLTISSNNVHDNAFEAIAASANLTPTVNTSGTAVTWVSGPQFDTGWKSGEFIVINGTQYTIASVTNATSLTLQSSAGTQSAVEALTLTTWYATITGNISLRNGSGTIGPGYFTSQSRNIIFQGNIAALNNLSGFQLGGSFMSLSGDQAIDNNVHGSILGQDESGFSIGCFTCSVTNVFANDDRATPLQVFGVGVFSGSNNTIFNNGNIFGSSSAIYDANALDLILRGNQSNLNLNNHSTVIPQNSGSYNFTLPALTGTAALTSQLSTGVSVSISSGSASGTATVPSGTGGCSFSPSNAAASSDLKTNGGYGAVSGTTFNLTLGANATGSDTFYAVCK